MLHRDPHFMSARLRFTHHCVRRVFVYLERLEWVENKNQLHSCLRFRLVAKSPDFNRRLWDESVN